MSRKIFIFLFVENVFCKYYSYVYSFIRKINAASVIKLVYS